MSKGRAYGEKLAVCKITPVFGAHDTKAVALVTPEGGMRTQESATTVFISRHRSMELSRSPQSASTGNGEAR
jgi:hypothetical protein